MRHRRSLRLLFTATLAFDFAIGALHIAGQNDAVAKNTSGVVEGPASTAPSTTSPEPARTTLTTRVGVQSNEPLSLSLDEAIRKALANNNSIEITRDDVRFQETQIRGILGFYDPVFS